MHLNHFTAAFHCSSIQPSTAAATTRVCRPLPPRRTRSAPQPLFFLPLALFHLLFDTKAIDSSHKRGYTCSTDLAGSAKLSRTQGLVIKFSPSLKLVDSLVQIARFYDQAPQPAHRSSASNSNGQAQQHTDGCHYFYQEPR